MPASRSPMCGRAGRTSVFPPLQGVGPTFDRAGACVEPPAAAAPPRLGLPSVMLFEPGASLQLSPSSRCQGVRAPLANAWELARAWPRAELVVVDDAGHGAPAALRRELRRATDGLVGPRSALAASVAARERRVAR